MIFFNQEDSYKYSWLFEQKEADFKLENEHYKSNVLVRKWQTAFNRDQLSDYFL